MMKGRQEVIVMMGHSKHHNCAICKMAKSVGIMESCTDASCTDPGHKEKTKEKEDAKK